MRISDTSMVNSVSKRYSYNITAIVHYIRNIRKENIKKTHTHTHTIYSIIR